MTKPKKPITTRLTTRLNKTDRKSLVFSEYAMLLTCFLSYFLSLFAYSKHNNDLNSNTISYTLLGLSVITGISAVAIDFAKTTLYCVDFNTQNSLCNRLRNQTNFNNSSIEQSPTAIERIFVIVGSLIGFLPCYFLRDWRLIQEPKKQKNLESQIINLNCEARQLTENFFQPQSILFNQ